MDLTITGTGHGPNQPGGGDATIPSRRPHKPDASTRKHTSLQRLFDHRPPYSFQTPPPPPTILISTSSPSRGSPEMTSRMPELRASLRMLSGSPFKSSRRTQSSEGSLLDQQRLSFSFVFCPSHSTSHGLFSGDSPMKTGKTDRSDRADGGANEKKSEALVTGLEPLKVRDLSKFLTSDPEGASKLMELMVQGMKPAQAVIWNTFKELEELQLVNLHRDFPNRHFLIGPFHKYFPALSTSLLTRDENCISWLDKQAPKSVLYVSFGSLAGVEESQFLEIAWGLANSKQPFLWVVRPGSVKGSEWLEPLPDGFLEIIAEGRGYIVKWAPQRKILAHRSIGGFWTHNGWNSTLESVCEGVPMICSPSFGDQLPNARNVSDVWKIGVELWNGFERGEIESVIKRVMVDEDGLEMKDRIMNLKEKANLCLKKGGSSYSSLEDLVKFILSC
ncbi:hypothetical protein E3N88_42621 [Mikania micrantha]|uniref:UDP-glycosyltransferases domain-containing protein n=1 Tax=Mikania micrantha TaxID=192012 RepID=A0A5N6LJG5_9ASTR|nr:hypothetical protein E3N88_42621 [Mikania micrantha]